MPRRLPIVVAVGGLVCASFLEWGPRLAAAADPLPPLDKAAAEQISFRQDVWPIVKRHCWGCHSGGDPKGGLSMDNVAAMLKGGDSGPLWTAGQPDKSLLVQMILGDKPDMPKDRPPLSPEKIQILRLWVLAGAKDDSLPGDGGHQVVIPATYGHPPAVTAVALSADGNLLAAACRSEVALADLSGDNPPRRLATECDLVTHVEFSPDGKLLAAAGGWPGLYGEVRLFAVEDGKLVSARRIGHDTLFRGNFAPDGSAIALGAADGAVYIVPVDAKQEARRLELHSDWVSDVAYSPDGMLLVTGGRDKATKISSVETGLLLRAVDSSAELIGAVATDGLTAVSAGRAKALTGYEIKLALAGIDVSGTGNAARPTSNKAQYTKAFEPLPGEALDMATSADHKRLAVVGAWGDARVYDMADRKRIAIVSKLPAPIYGVALNGDGTRLAVGTYGGEVQVYEVPSGSLVKSLVPVPVAATAAAN